MKKPVQLKRNIFLVVSLDLRRFLHLRNPLIAKALDGFYSSDTVQELSSNNRELSRQEKNLGKREKLNP